MVEFGLTLVDITEGMLLIFQSINMMAAAGAVSFLGSAQIALAGVCIGVSVWSCIQTFKLFDAYMDGNEEAGEIIVKQTIFDVILTVGLSLFSELAKPILSLTLKNKLVKSLGADVVEELLANGAKLEDISKLVTNLKKLGLSDEVISMFAKNFGDTGLDWLRKARGLGASPDVLKQLSQMDGFADKMDEIFELMKGSSKSADDVAECLIKNGDEAIEIIRKYGDDAVDAIIVHGDDAVTIIGKYGDDAVDRLKQGKTPDEIEKELGGKPGYTIDYVKLSDELGTKLKEEGYTILSIESAEKANADWADMGYGLSPIAEGTKVYKVQAGNYKYARVFKEGVNSAKSPFILRVADIIGLNAMEIAEKYSLPQIPDKVVYIDIPKDIILEVSIVGP